MECEKCEKCGKREIVATVSDSLEGGISRVALLNSLERGGDGERKEGEMRGGGREENEVWLEPEGEGEGAEGGEDEEKLEGFVGR